jgi:cytoskeleton protein RodZ
MPTVAEQLRQAREQRGWTINQLADATKIRTDHIRALEEGNYNVFAAPVYIQGFVRTCATLLKLDVPKVMADLDGELGATKKFRQHPPLTENSKGFVDWVMLQLSKINWRVGLPVAILGLVLVGGIITYRTIQTRKNVDPLKDLGPGIYQPKGRQDTVMPPVVAPPPTNTGRANR